MGISNQNSHSGNQSVFIKSLQLATTEEYGTLATTVKPGKYRGKKIKYSAWLKTEEVDSACLWMRIDSPKGITLNFDNMRCRGVHGTTDWHNNSIILYVPDSADQLWFLHSW